MLFLHGRGAFDCVLLLCGCIFSLWWTMCSHFCMSFYGRRPTFVSTFVYLPLSENGRNLFYGSVIVPVYVITRTRISSYTGDCIWVMSCFRSDCCDANKSDSQRSAVRPSVLIQSDCSLSMAIVAHSDSDSIPPREERTMNLERTGDGKGKHGLHFGNWIAGP